MSRRLIGIAAAGLAVAGCAGLVGLGSREPKLVLVLVVDQLRPERISAEQPGGLGRLVREGRVFPDAAFGHAFTETCPGHATVLTGLHPAGHGIIGNAYRDPETLEERYCVEDRAADAAVLTRPGEASSGRSPRALRVGSLGDWAKAQRPGTRVFSVSVKDRSAIVTAGRDGDAAYWLARGEEPAFVTSGYYRSALPDWVVAWNREALLRDVPEDWTYTPESAAASAAGERPDDYPHESPAFSRVQPHPLLRDPPGIERLPERMRHAAERIYVSPFADAITLAFARELVVREDLGRGPHADLLTVALSATDLVGHFYGPESWEARDALARLDADLGDFLRFLEERVGRGRVLVALTADHGVLPIPEWILERGRSRCPIPDGRVDPLPMVARLNAHLTDRFGGERGVHWLELTSSRLVLNRGHVAATGAPAEEILAIARTRLAAEPGIARVWTAGEALAGEGPEPLARLYHNAWNELTGDLAIQVEEDCLLAGLRIATSHGSPYEYDRRVPLVFWGPGVPRGRVPGEAGVVDVAPTLATLLGLSVPGGLDGRSLVPPGSP